MAQKYKVSTAQLAQWNDVSTNASFKYKQAVVLFLPSSVRVNKTAPHAGSTKKTTVVAVQGKKN